MKKNKKSVFLVSSILGCTALVSVGFAAWMITTTPDPVTLNGDIIVETVTDTNISFVQDEFVWTDSDDDPENNQKIIFGGREAEPGDWLVNSTLEHLSTTLTIVVENYTELEKVKVSLAASDPEKYQAAVTAGYVAALPTIADVKVASFSQVDGQPTKGKADIQITFDWGTAFGGNNPMDYYNEMDSSTVNGADAKNKLTALYNNLNGLTYTLTLTAVAKTSV